MLPRPLISSAKGCFITLRSKSRDGNLRHWNLQPDGQRRQQIALRMYPTTDLIRLPSCRRAGRV